MDPRKAPNGLGRARHIQINDSPDRTFVIKVQIVLSQNKLRPDKGGQEGSFRLVSGI